MKYQKSGGNMTSLGLIQICLITDVKFLQCSCKPCQFLRDEKASCSNHHGDVTSVPDWEESLYFIPFQRSKNLNANASDLRVKSPVLQRIHQLTNNSTVYYGNLLFHCLSDVSNHVMLQLSGLQCYILFHHLQMEGSKPMMMRIVMMTLQKLMTVLQKFCLDRKRRNFEGRLV